MDRWRGRRLAGLALATLIAASLGGVGADARPHAGPWIVLRSRDGGELARTELPADGAFALRYRNSLYGSLAEERLRLSGDDLILESIAADEVAVLEEYYGVTGAIGPAPGPRRWSAAHRAPPIDLPLHIQATPLGERTLLAGSRELALWRLPGAGQGTLVILAIEGSE